MASSVIQGSRVSCRFSFAPGNAYGIADMNKIAALLLALAVSIFMWAGLIWAVMRVIG